MAATVKIKGDTKDAQQKVQRLRKDVERLDRECKRPKKIRIQGDSKGLLNTIKGTAIGTALGNMGSKLGGDIWQMLLQNIPAIGQLIGQSIGSGVDKEFIKFGQKWRMFFDSLAVYGNPSSEALSRGDKLDALDDERRSHNSKSNAEEMGYSRAFSNIAGVNGTQIVDRIQSVLDMATSGNIAEMDKAWGQLAGFGVTYDDIQTKSTWQVLEKMLGAYAAAGADGENELEPAFQQIVGKRQIAAVRKIGDGTELREQAGLFAKEFTRLIPNEAQILEAAGQSEVKRTLAEIQGMAIPEQGVSHIGREAQNLYDIAEFQTGLIGGGESAGAAMQKQWNDLNVFATLLDAIGEKLKSVFIPDLGFSLGGGDETTNAVINVGTGEVNVASANPLSVSPPVQIQGTDNFTLANAEIPTPQVTDTNVSPTLYKGEQQLGTAVRELTREIRNNTSASTQVTDVMRHLQFPTPNISVSSEGATFQ